MKRTLKRLVLNKETIRQLTPSSLAQVVGGGIKSSVTDVCSTTDRQCQTAGFSAGWCGSNLCPPESAGCSEWRC
jgi:hypothetical protein